LIKNYFDELRMELINDLAGF